MRITFLTEPIPIKPRRDVVPQQPFGGNGSCIASSPRQHLGSDQNSLKGACWSISTATLSSCTSSPVMVQLSLVGTPPQEVLIDNSRVLCVDVSGRAVSKGPPFMLNQKNLHDSGAHLLSRVCTTIGPRGLTAVFGKGTGVAL